jgi:hypothetical protein
MAGRALRAEAGTVPSTRLSSELLMATLRACEAAQNGLPATASGLSASALKSAVQVRLQEVFSSSVHRDSALELSRCKLQVSQTIDEYYHHQVLKLVSEINLKERTEEMCPIIQPFDCVETEVGCFIW